MLFASLNYLIWNLIHGRTFCTECVFLVLKSVYVSNVITVVDATHLFYLPAVHVRVHEVRANINFNINKIYSLFKKFTVEVGKMFIFTSKRMNHASCLM